MSIPIHSLSGMHFDLESSLPEWFATTVSAQNAESVMMSHARVPHTSVPSQLIHYTGDVGPPVL
jgi:hypothetical protein